MHTKARRLSEEEIWELTIDARIVAIRWDLIPWSLVLDLDAPESEREDAGERRAWLVFDDISEISWPFVEARVPIGPRITGGLAASGPEGGFNDFTFAPQLPQFTESGELRPFPDKDVTIRARAVRAVISTGSAPSEEFGLARALRLSLATDDELLEVLEGSPK